MKNLLTGIGLLIVSMLVLSACATSGSSDEGGSTGSDGGVDKSEVTIAFQENIQTMDPHNGSAGIDNSVQYAIYESMFTPDEDGELQPLLATDYEVSDDGLTYTFKLRDDVTFTDGAEFNAEAVKANLDRIIDSEGSLNNYKSLRDVGKVEVTGDYEVEVTLNNINSQFINKIGMLRMASPDALENDIDFGEESAGTGPFVLEKWNHGDSLVAIKNEDYWEEDLPKLDKVTFKPIPEDGSRIAMLKTGEADYIFPVPVNDVESLEAEDNIEVSIVESTYVNYATINTSKEPFNKKEVRQAMNYALNQEDFVKVVKNGYGIVSDSVLPATNNYYAAQDPYDYDLEKAKELLADAGYEDGFSTEIWGSDSSKDKRGMQFIQQQLGEIGIDVEIKQMERGTLSDEINKPESAEDSKVEMWYVGWSSQVGDADNATNPLFSSSSFPPNGSNTAYYDNEEADKLIEEGLHAKSEEEAIEKYAELQEILWDDAPWLFTAVDEEPTAMRKGLKGIWRSADGNFYLREVKWE